MSGNVYPAEPRIRWDYLQINELLLWATHSGMSDLCLRSGLPAWMRLNGVWRQVTQRPITTDELLAALERLTKNNSVSALIKSGQSDYDFAHEIEESRGVRRRYRGNATPVADGYSTGVKIVFRAIPSMPPALEDLNVEQGILDHAMPSNGLVLVTGVMGSGKSTLLAAIWDGELVCKVGAAAAAEVKENNISVWLAPAVNIHRNPLCGRNFEYYSEDPLLTGRLAGAMVRGIQSQNVAATVKHFACNNKETNRKYSDSRLSQRALREIYLKAFEIILREEQPWAIMSSYNVVNGRRASESRELLTTILREEWGYAGLVMSDWWTRGEHYKEILAGNDLKMANGYPERVEEAMKLGAVNRSDLKSCARRVLELILEID